MCKLQEAVVEAEEERVKKEKNVLATVRSLVTDMVKARRAKSSSGTIDSTSALDALLQQRGTNTMQQQQETDVEDVLGSILNSGEKALALETFFVIMAVLIKQESERFETNNPDLETLTEDKSADNGGTPTTSKISNLEQLPRDIDSSKGMQYKLLVIFGFEIATNMCSCDCKIWHIAGTVIGLTYTS